MPPKRKTVKTTASKATPTKTTRKTASESSSIGANTSTSETTTTTPETTTTAEISNAQSPGKTIVRKTTISRGKTTVPRKTTPKIPTTTVVTETPKSPETTTPPAEIIATSKSVAEPASAIQPETVLSLDSTTAAETIVADKAASETTTAPTTTVSAETACFPESNSVPNATSEITAATATTIATTTPETTSTSEIAVAPDASPKTMATPDTTASQTAASPTLERTTGPENTASEGSSKNPKRRTVIKVTKKIVKRKKVIPKPAKDASQLPSKVDEEKDETNTEAITDPTPINPTENEILGQEIPTSSSPVKSPPHTQNANPADTPVAASEVGNLGAARDYERTVSERQKRRKTEIFIGGLDKDAKEEDIRKVFEKVGEVVEVRLMMNSQTGKNKGYAFLRYASAADAKRATSELAKVEVCGKQCGATAVEGNDTIFLGNIDKRWKKEDVLKLLQEIGIENIDLLTIMKDPNDPNCNRGFAFLELETNKDAQIAYKRLQKKDAFGKDRNIKVSWAEPLNDPDEEEMLKVKSVYAEGIPSSWDEDKVRNHFKKFGEIERVVLARNIHSARRKDFAFVNYINRESALTCIESFSKEELIDEGSKVNVKVSLAKPVSKGKQSKGGSKPSSKNHIIEKLKPIKYDTNATTSNKGKHFGGQGGDKRSSTTHELIQILREQAAWRQGQTGLARGSTIQDYQDYVYTSPQGKRPFSTLGVDMLYSNPRRYSRARLDSSAPAASSSTLSHGMSGSTLPYYQQPGAGYTAGSLYGATNISTTFQTRHGSAQYGSGVYPRY